MRIKRLNILALILFLAFAAAGCSDEPLTIGLSKAGSPNYEHWLKQYDENIRVYNLYDMDRGRAIKTLEKCDGLILTGGADVHPGRFGRPEDSVRCSIDRVRDTLEFALIKKAMLLELPMLGICRGEQILNVAFGGSLIVDIPEDYDAKHLHRCDDPAECFHPVEIVNGSNLFRLTRLKKGMVNTNHHQAIDELADEFAKTAVSPGGIIEAIEWKDAIGEPFLIAVQWHPERMEQDNPLSYKIGEAFIKEAKEFQEKSCD